MIKGKQAEASQRVLALCLHPALDVTVYSDHGKEILRREDLGGKAVNLARMLHMLGANVTLCLPDDPEGLTKAYLDRCDFEVEYLDLNLPLRRNFKYVDSDGTISEQNSTAGPISPQQYEQLIHRVLHICKMRKISLLALCGSFPQGVEKDVYKYLTEQANALNISCVTDASGKALSLAVQAKPLLIKPNLQEFSTLISQDISMLKTQEQVEKAVIKAYCDTGTRILCSMDKRGSIYAGPEGIFTVQSRMIEHVNGFVGAGDTMLACFLWKKFLCGAPIEDALRFASSAATRTSSILLGRPVTMHQSFALVRAT